MEVGQVGAGDPFRRPSRSATQIKVICIRIRMFFLQIYWQIGCERRRKVRAAPKIFVLRMKLHYKVGRYQQESVGG